MKFIGTWFGGGKADAGTLVKHVRRSLESGGIDDDLWDECLKAEGLEDVLDEHLPHEKLANLAAERPSVLFGMASRCVNAMEETLEEKVDRNGELGESFEMAAINSLMMLSRVFAVAHSSEPLKPNQAEGNPGLLASMWSRVGVENEGRPLASRAITATMRLLFFDGFCAEAPIEKEKLRSRKKKNGNTECDEAPVDVRRLWESGVGPETKDDDRQDAADEAMCFNRTLGLQLLISGVCGASPVTAAAAADASSVAENGHGQGRGAAKRKAAAKMSVPSGTWIRDARFLAYLTDPSSDVPFRAELFYSLLSVALSYDPNRGIGVPFAKLFANSAEEDYVWMCMQVLCLLLQDENDKLIPTSGAIKAWNPQESRNLPLERFAAKGPGQRRQIFRELLVGISSEKELEFMVQGVTELLGSVNATSVLPGNAQTLSFLPELLVLIFHLAGCDAFVKHLGDSGGEVVEGVIDIMAEEPEGLDTEALAVLGGATLLRLTSHWEVASVLNEDYNGDAPDDLPTFEGTTADLVALVALNKVADRLGKNEKLHLSTIETYLGLLTNVSTFSESFCVPTCLRFFSLFERFAKQVKRGTAGSAKYLLHLLEVLKNVVHYQYGTNADLVYCIMTRRLVFTGLAELVDDICDKALSQSVKPGAESNGIPCGKYEDVPDQPDDQPDDQRDDKPNVKDEADRDEADSETVGGEGIHCLRRNVPFAETVQEEAPSAAIDDAELWRSLQVNISPLMDLITEVAPKLEAEIKKKEISNPEKAKEFLPKSIIGFLPVPHAFTMRTIGYSGALHLACERCLLAAIAIGPVGEVWEDGVEDRDSDEAPEERGRNEGSSSGRRARSSSRRGADENKLGSAARSASTSKTKKKAKPETPSSSEEESPRHKSKAKDKSRKRSQARVKNDLAAQLEAAQAAGVDIVALLQMLQAQQAAAASATPAQNPKS